MRVSNIDAWKKIARREPFQSHTGSFSGGRYRGLGVLPAAFAKEFLKIAGREDDAYFVYSYATPIGCYIPSEDEWIAVPVKFSRTTSRHQGVMNRGIRYSQIGE